MTMSCQPIVEPYADVVDGWVVVCDCGLSVTYADEDEARARRDEHRRGDDHAS